MSFHLSVLVGLSCLFAVTTGASDDLPHYHQGVLKPYALGPPQILLSQRDEGKLRSGRAVMQAMAADDDTRRMIMVQDIKAPANVVLGRIMDFQNYDTMVSGVDSCVNYVSYTEAGVQTVKSTYEISAVHMKFKYFVEHTYDPEQRCMTFHLDYSRRSDLDDSVGYWYVEPDGRQACRVYYSCECKLRGWVPGPVLNVLQKEALKKATTWVNAESLKEWHAMRACSANNPLVRFVDDVRSSVQQIKLPSVRPSPWLASRRRDAVQFVSAVRSGKARSSNVVIW